MDTGLETAQHLVTALLNLAVAVLTGATVSQSWLAGDASGWAAVRRAPVRGVAVAGATVALVAAVAWLWLEAAAMAEVPVTAAADATWTMITSTHAGVAYCVGFAGLLVAAAGTGFHGGRGAGPIRATLAGLAVFWYTRSMVSHASSDGDFSVRLLADWVHLGLVSLWVGDVILSGGVVLRRPSADMSTADRRARAAYVASLSRSATFALAGIVVTGVYAAWRSLGGPGGLVGNPYGNTLVAKLLLVGVAVLLGAINRFVVMPPWLARESAGVTVPAAFPLRFRRILWIEAAMLLAVVVLAAWLVSTPPPGPPAQAPP